MDVITLKLCTFALCSVLTISWIGVQRTNVNDEPLRNWTLVSICFVCYAGVAVAGDVYFSNTTTLLPSLFLVAAHGFILNGLSAHIYAKKRYLTGIVCVGLVAFVHVLFPRNAPLSLAFTLGS
ncbi:hypothetical protein, partial [Alteromonas sp. 14N.309.X.WAT.G.H12]|uniref:hypothetical protein n=1 Tax=Alteromonas sp. 14N.309.X.WAT.G.H12 TaxID=3120824 RepID=UPI002FCECD6D